MNKNIRSFCIWFMQVAGICAIVLFSVCPVSCKVTDEGLQILHGDYTAPVIESYSVTDAFSVAVLFSKKIHLTGAVLIPAAEASASQSDGSGDVAPSLEPEPGADNAVTVNVAYDETGRRVTVTASEELSAGGHYELYGDAADETGNTLTFCIPFTGYNSRVPRMLMSEIHPGYVSGSNRCEFIELYALTAGNLAGLKVYSANDGGDRGFVLPASEVKAGDVIILHMRQKGGNCVSETGNDLSLAEGSEKNDYVSATARDLWADNEKACLGEKEDVIVLADSFSGDFIDAVMYAPSGTASWSKDCIRDAAGRVVSAGIWSSAEPSAAV
ncbi:MAG TPA: hypothetical protein DCL73_13960, partial [Treponema sp.]|nr:hypothetical protein [Treponema sp.]